MKRVASKVRSGRFRRRHLVPLPKVETLGELNELIALADVNDDARHIFGHVKSVGTEFADELPALRPLPDEPFEMMLALNPRVDHKSRGLCAPMLLFGPGPLCRTAHRCLSRCRARRSP